MVAVILVPSSADGGSQTVVIVVVGRRNEAVEVVEHLFLSYEIGHQVCFCGHEILVKFLVFLHLFVVTVAPCVVKRYVGVPV